MAALRALFLDAYEDTEVIAELKNQLAVPSGLAWIWWAFAQALLSQQKEKDAWQSYEA